MDTHFEEIFQGWLEKEEQNKNKGFLKKSKYWKKYFCVLRRYDGDENVYFQWFEREEDWRKEFPKGSFSLFPKYWVFKHKQEKGKNMFEISNDDEAHYLMAVNEKTMDLWVIQFMMQTRLSASMAENSFRVKGGEGKCLQRIGAKNLNCLLHLSEWGITLALERTHSVLSQWPLTTIRNYECTDNNEFVFEAGRKSPMGEGKYNFHTTNSEDNDIFDQLDRFTSLRAKRVRSANGRKRRDSGLDDEEIAQAYGKLRWSVMLNNSTLNLGVIPAMSAKPLPIGGNDKQIYNRLERNSFASTAIADSYDRLDRGGSFTDHSSQITDTSYRYLNSTSTLQDRQGSRGTLRGMQFNDSYDHLERGSSVHGAPGRTDSRSRSFGSLEGGSRSRFSSWSSPPLEDSYNHLDRYRHSSWSSSQKNMGTATSREFYDKLDRSRGSVHQGDAMNSYDHLDRMQENVSPGQTNSVSPPRPQVDAETAIHDAFGNLIAHVPQPYPWVNIRATEQEASPVGELPPPLPQKPSCMMKAEPENENSQTHQQDADYSNRAYETRNRTISRETPVSGPVMEVEPSSAAVQNPSSHYQDVDEATSVAYESAEPRSRLNTHSSDTDLWKLSLGKDSGLDPSKRSTLHHSAPTLALYSVVKKDKSGKGSPKGLSKAGSNFKLDSILKRIGRISKKSEDDSVRRYEKVSRKSKKTQQKLDKHSVLGNESSSSLRRLVADDESSAYAEIHDDDTITSASTRRKMERSESKRPLPDLPQDKDANT